MRLYLAMDRLFKIIKFMEMDLPWITVLFPFLCNLVWSYIVHLDGRY